MVTVDHSVRICGRNHTFVLAHHGEPRQNYDIQRPCIGISASLNPLKNRSPSLRIPLGELTIKRLCDFNMHAHVSIEITQGKINSRACISCNIFVEKIKSMLKVFHFVVCLFHISYLPQVAFIVFNFRLTTRHDRGKPTLILYRCSTVDCPLLLICSLFTMHRKEYV